MMSVDTPLPARAILAVPLAAAGLAVTTLAVKGFRRSRALPVSRPADQLAVFLAAMGPVALDGGAPLLPRNAGAGRLRLVSASAHGQFARLVYSVG
jgi:hypothetical protein